MNLSSEPSILTKPGTIHTSVQTVPTDIEDVNEVVNN